VGGWAAASVARWPKFQPKSSKGAGEKKSWLEDFVAEFCRKGAEEIFGKNFLLGQTFF
jgi:hypothetical protein